METDHDLARSASLSPRHNCRCFCALQNRFTCQLCFSSTTQPTVVVVEIGPGVRIWLTYSKFSARGGAALLEISWSLTAALGADSLRMNTKGRGVRCPHFPQVGRVLSRMLVHMYSLTLALSLFSLLCAFSPVSALPTRTTNGKSARWSSDFVKRSGAKFTLNDK